MHRQSCNALPAQPLDLVATFDTIFNSLEPVSRERVVVSVSPSHQRLSAPSLDKEAIEATWERLTQPVPLQSACDGSPSQHELETKASETKVSQPVVLSTGNPKPTSAQHSTPVDGAHEPSLSPQEVVQTLETKPVLFNGLKFRLHDVDILEEGRTTCPCRSDLDLTAAHSTVEPGRQAAPQATPNRSAETSIGRAGGAPMAPDPLQALHSSGVDVGRNASRALESPDSSHSHPPTTGIPSSTSPPHLCDAVLPVGTERDTTACVAHPKHVAVCTLKLGITDYKTSTGTTTHVSTYEKYVSQHTTDQDVLFEFTESGDPDGGVRDDASHHGDGSKRKHTREENAAGTGGAAESQQPLVISDSSVLPRSLSMPVRCEEAVGTSAFITRCTERYLANALGVEAMVVTRDHSAVLFRRSHKVGEYPGYYCCPGGHPEPSHILNVKRFTATHRDKRTGSTPHDEARLPDEACHWFQYVNEDIVVHELFDSVLLEVAEEIGMPLSSCRNRGLVSIIRHAKTRKPDMCFLVEVNGSDEEVRRTFNERRAEEAFESVEGSLVFMPLHRVRTPADVVHFVDNHLDGKITPASYAALLHGVQCVRLLS